jgi:hypothetical protein
MGLEVFAQIGPVDAEALIGQPLFERQGFLIQSLSAGIYQVGSQMSVERGLQRSIRLASRLVGRMFGKRVGDLAVEENDQLAAAFHTAFPCPGEVDELRQDALDKMVPDIVRTGCRTRRQPQGDDGIEVVYQAVRRAGLILQNRQKGQDQSRIPAPEQPPDPPMFEHREKIGSQCR